MSAKKRLAWHKPARHEIYEGERKFFIFLDIIAVVGLLMALISFYRGLYLNGGLSLLIPIIVFIFYLVRSVILKR